MNAGRPYLVLVLLLFVATGVVALFLLGADPAGKEVVGIKNEGGRQGSGAPRGLSGASLSGGEATDPDRLAEGTGDLDGYPEDKISGRVVSAGTDRGVAGATVDVRISASHFQSVLEQRGDPPASRIVTNQQGAFEVGLPFTRLTTLHVSAPGFSPRRVEWRAWAELQGVVELYPLGELVVRVVDQEGEPVEGVFVTVLPANGRAGPLPEGWPRFYQERRYDPSFAEFGAFVSETDPQGTLRIGSLACGMPLRVTASQRVQKLEAVAEIDPHTRYGEVLLQANRGATVRGRVICEDGGVPPPGHVVLSSTHVPDVQVCILLGDGSYEFGSVPPGEVTVRTGNVGRESISFMVVSPLTTAPDLVVRRTHRIEGQVVSSASRRYFRVDAFLEEDRVSSEVTDDRGQFHLEAPPGVITLRVAQTRFRGPYLAEKAIISPAADVVQIEVSDDEYSALEMPVRAVSGQDCELLLFPHGVTDRNGLEATVTGSKQMFPGRVDDEGLLLAQGLPVGTFDVSIDFGGAGAVWLKAVTLSARSVTRLPIQSPGFAKVIVTGSAATERWELASAGTAGKTPFAQVSEGSMEATVPAGPWLAYPVSPSATRRNAQPLDLHIGTHRLELSARLGAVAVTVLKEAEPLVGADVLVIGDRYYSLPGNQPMVSLSTDDQGQAVFEGTPEGEHDVLVRGTNHWVWRSTEVVACETTEITVDLSVGEELAVQFEHEGIILSSIEMVSAFIDLADRGYVGARMQGDRLVCRLPAGGPVLFCLQVPRGQRDHYVHMLAMTPSLQGGDVIQTCPGELVLELPAGGWIPSTARLDLISVQGHPVRISKSTPVSTISHRERGNVVFSCLPDRSTWRLFIKRSDGTDHSQLVEFEGSGSKTIKLE